MARQRFFSPVIVRGEEEKGVRYWGYGKMAYKQLINLVLNPDYGDITDLETGSDLTIRYGKPAGAQYPQTEITPRRRSSPTFSPDISQQETLRILGSAPDFDEVFSESRKTPQEVGNMLDEWLSSDEDTGKNVEKYGNSDSSTSSLVDEKLGQLLNSGAV